jgi:hypothetical protein
MTENLEAIKQSPSVLRIYQDHIKLSKEGKEYLGLCPIHNEKTPSLRVYQHEGVWLFKCFGCNRSGNIFQFVEAVDKVPFGEAVRRVKEYIGGSWESKKALVEKTFSPVNKESDHYKTFTMEQYYPLEQNLANSKEALTYLTKRGINLDTARNLKFGFVSNLGNLAGEKNNHLADKGWLALPCIADGRVVCLKYRSIVDKVFIRQPGMQTSLFNTDSIDPFSPVYLCEGEFDAAVLTQAGYNAVSLPSANIEVTPEMKDKLMEAECVILAGDSDSPGTEAMRKLWAQLDRTYLLNWPIGFKDANEVFVTDCGKDLETFKTLVADLTSIAKSAPMPNIYSLTESMQSASQTNLADHPKRFRFPWPSVDKMAILLPGSVASIFATQTKQGKTAWVMNATLFGARNHNEVVLNYSCELSTDEFSTIVTSHVLRKDRNHLVKADHVLAAKQLGGIKYYIGYDPTLTTVTPVLDLIEAAVQRLGATVVVLDHIHFIIRNEKDTVKAQEDAFQRIKNMSVKYGLKFIVVGQPRKTNQQNKGKAVHVSDWKGSETGGSDASAIYSIHRDNVRCLDPLNPPKDDYDTKTEIHLHGARFKGEGNTFTVLKFIGEYASFVEETNIQEPYGKAAEV